VRLEIDSAVVEHDLAMIYAHIAQHHMRSAERFLRAVEATFNRVTQEFWRGTACFARPPLRDLQMLPVLGHRNYLLFYRRDWDSVRIVYVVHAAWHRRRLFSRK
jgi:plasmid stabilization system protein ParE